MKQFQINFDLSSVTVNVIALCLAIIINFSVTAQEYNSGSISFNIDNDGLLGSDRGYSNGIFFKYHSDSVVNLENFSPIAIQKVAKLLPLQQNTDKGWGVSLGQQIWTPDDISSKIELENDRPYAGLLFVKALVFESSDNMANKYSFMFGLVGSNALAEESQKAIHSLIGSKKPMGWQRQIENQKVYNFSYETQALLLREQVWNKQDCDVSFIGRVNIGNFQNEIAVGGAIRWGRVLNESFASVGLAPGNYIDVSVLSQSKSGQFSYLALEGRYRFDDITIDGARPEHVFNVNTQHWQSTLSSGFVFYKESWGVALSVIASSSDYKEDIRHYNATASVEVFWRG